MAFILWNSFFTLDFFLTRDTCLVPCALCLVISVMSARVA